jgi:hypothetical protein
LDTQCWARNVFLTAGTTYQFSLAQPAAVTTTTNGVSTTVTPEYDLHLYPITYTANLSSGPSNGSDADPTELAESELTTGATQVINYTALTSGTYFIVAKRITGTGAFTLTSTGPTASVGALTTTVTDASTNADIANAVVLAENSNGLVINSGPTATTGSKLGQASFSILGGSVTKLVVSAPGYFTRTVSVASSAATASVTLTAAPVFSPGLQMISLPGTSTAIDGDTYPLIFVDAIWTPGNEEYNLPPSSLATNFATGSSYWVRLRQPTTLINPPAPVAAGSFNISLQAGWNMIGSPYASPGTLSTASVTIGTVSQSFVTAFTNQLISGFWAFNPSTGFYVTPITNPGTALAPYVGYWVFASQSETLTLTGS